MRVIFLGEHEGAQSVRVETPQDEIGDVVEAFRVFLLAMGFHPNNVKEVLGE